jgi:hypothetical protein
MAQHYGYKILGASAGGKPEDRINVNLCSDVLQKWLKFQTLVCDIKLSR